MHRFVSTRTSSWMDGRTDERTDREKDVGADSKLTSRLSFVIHGRMFLQNLKK